MLYVGLKNNECIGCSGWWVGDKREKEKFSPIALLELKICLIDG